MFYSVEQVSYMTGISVLTLHKWKKQGRFIPDKIINNGIKRYSEVQLNVLLSIFHKNKQ